MRVLGQKTTGGRQTPPPPPSLFRAKGTFNDRSFSICSWFLYKSFAKDLMD